MKGDILLHLCCGPCALHPVRELRREGLEPHGFFFNPNIQPLSELERRREALGRLAEQEHFAYEEDLRYPLEDFLETALSARDRCLSCYRWRLAAAAEAAAAGGYRAFSTSLLVSPWQRHDEIAAIGAEEAASCGVEFLYRDWRPGWPAARNEVRRRDIYLQPYCGCIFSERDRYIARMARARRADGAGAASGT